MALLIHPGFHKTGTTWLQEQLFTDKTLFNMLMPHADIDALIVRPHDFNFNPAMARARLLARLGPPELVDVLSSEILVGNPFSGSRDAVTLATRLHKIAPDARIVLTIREQGAMMRSLYQQYIKRGGSLSLVHFLAQRCEPGYFGFDPQTLEYERYASLYAGLYGKHNVLVLPQELLARNPREFVDRLLTFAGRPGLSDDHELPTEKAGKSFPPGGTPLIRIANYLRPSVLHPGGPRISVTVAEFLVRLGYTCKVGSRRQEQQWRSTVNPLRERYATSNRLLQAFCPVRLAELGYPFEMPVEEAR